MMKVTLNRPWLTVCFDAPMRVLSWAINQPGFVLTETVLWREVRNADLPEDLDVMQWLTGELSGRDASEGVAFLTSRDVRAYCETEVTVDRVTARCIATVGLSNAEAIGQRVDRTAHDWGTINILVATNHALSDVALIETLSLVAEARTVAVMATGLTLPTGVASGTGTDCIAVAAPEGTDTFAGKHTAIGEAVGRAVFEAVSAGATEWMRSVRREVTS